MDAIRNRRDVVFGEHRAADLAMLHGHAVHKARKAQRDVGHVHHAIVTSADALYSLCRLGAQDAVGLLHGEAVVSGWHGSMGGEDAMLTHRIQIAVLRAGKRSAGQRLFQKSERQQSGVPLIHVVNADVVPERIEHPQAAHAKHNLLLQAVVGIAAVQAIGQGTVVRIVALQIGVEHVDGNGVTSDAFHVIAPGAHMYTGGLLW